MVALLRPRTLPSSVSIRTLRRMRAVPHTVPRSLPCRYVRCVPCLSVFPITTTVPLVAVSMPPRMLSAVVLPAPDWPRITLSLPSSAVKLAPEVLQLLQDICHDEHMTVLIITHNSALAPMAHKIIRFRSGPLTHIRHVDCIFRAVRGFAERRVETMAALAIDRHTLDMHTDGIVDAINATQRVDIVIGQTHRRHDLHIVQPLLLVESVRGEERVAAGSRTIRTTVSGTRSM